MMSAHIFCHTAFLLCSFRSDGSSSRSTSSSNFPDHTADRLLLKHEASAQKCVPSFVSGANTITSTPLGPNAGESKQVRLRITCPTDDAKNNFLVYSRGDENYGQIKLVRIKLPVSTTTLPKRLPLPPRRSSPRPRILTTLCTSNAVMILADQL